MQRNRLCRSYQVIKLYITKIIPFLNQIHKISIIIFKLLCKMVFFTLPALFLCLSLIALCERLRNRILNGPASDLKFFSSMRQFLGIFFKSWRFKCSERRRRGIVFHISLPRCGGLLILDNSIGTW